MKYKCHFVALCFAFLFYSTAWECVIQMGDLPLSLVWGARIRKTVKLLHEPSFLMWQSNVFKHLFCDPFPLSHSFSSHRVRSYTIHGEPIFTLPHVYTKLLECSLVRRLSFVRCVSSSRISWPWCASISEIFDLFYWLPVPASQPLPLGHQGSVAWLKISHCGPSTLFLSVPDFFGYFVLKCFLFSYQFLESYHKLAGSTFLIGS